MKMNMVDASRVRTAEPDYAAIRSLREHQSRQEQASSGLIRPSLQSAVAVSMSRVSCESKNSVAVGACGQTIVLVSRGKSVGMLRVSSINANIALASIVFAVIEISTGLPSAWVILVISLLASEYCRVRFPPVSNHADTELSAEAGGE